MLEHEYQVKEDGHDREYELDNVERVSSEQGLASRHCVDDQLEHREDAASEVENHVYD